MLVCLVDLCFNRRLKYCGRHVKKGRIVGRGTDDAVGMFFFVVLRVSCDAAVIS